MTNNSSSEKKKCAPGNTFKDGSCIPLDLLIKMAEAYNNHTDLDDKINLNHKLETINQSKYKKYLLKQFSNRLGEVCNNQKCWLKQKFINDINKKYKFYLKKLTFKPKSPQGKFTWLNTTNINDVMVQYEHDNNDFKFLGAVPIDFDDLPELGIKDLNFEKLKNDNISKLGAVFNLDTHDQPGSHWVAMYSDLKNKKVYFFDSYGTRPDARISKFMRRIGKNIENNSLKNIDIRHNTHRHQYKNSECGVYSLNFIIRLLKGESFDKVVKEKTDDDKMNNCRKIYFTKE